MGKVVYSHRQKFARYPGGDSAGRNAANKSNNDPNPRNQPMLMRQYDSILLKIDEFLPRLSLTGIHRRNSSRSGHIGPKFSNQTKNGGRMWVGGTRARANDCICSIA